MNEERWLPIGSRVWSAKLDDAVVLHLRLQHAVGALNLRATARALGVTHSTLGSAIHGRDAECFRACRRRVDRRTACGGPRAGRP